MGWKTHVANLPNDLMTLARTGQVLWECWREIAVGLMNKLLLCDDETNTKQIWYGLGRGLLLEFGAKLHVRLSLGVFQDRLLDGRYVDFPRSDEGGDG